MLVKLEEFWLLLKKITSGLGKYDEVITAYNDNPEQKDNSVYYFKHYTSEINHRLNGYRTVDPVKILFYLSREKVYPFVQNIRKRVIVGVKACDLRALQLLDKAMLLSGFVDPAYKHWRENTLIISSDCDFFHETCSCNLVNGKPYPETGFDLNLSLIDDYYYIQIGSEKGKEFIDLIKNEITVLESTDAEKQVVTSNRQNALNKLIEKNKHLINFGRYSEFRKVKFETWIDESKECVGCGACTNICPTCYCLILNDEAVKQEEFVKVRSYDSCQWYGYARVAGGGTPRPKMYERFRHRYLCKFDYMHKNFNEIGCTGCGRCTEACPAKIDFREVVKTVDTLTQ